MITHQNCLYYVKTGEGRSILLIHGLMMNGDMFHPIISELAQSYSVIAPDLRGFSRSGHLEPPYTVEQHAQDLASLMNSLSISSSIVLGYSMGGAVAQQLALDFPTLLSRLILCNTFANNRITWQEKIEGAVMPWMIRMVKPKQLAHMFKGLTPSQMNQIEMMIASNQSTNMILTTKNLLSFDSRHRLNEITCPTLVIRGSEDTTVPSHHAQLLSQGITGAELRIIPHAGHEMMWTHSAELIDVIESFMKGS
jgi:3-oxoadipate enol-lactonase